MFIELQEDNLETVLSQNESTLVMYGAGWCGNCKLLKPKFKKVSTENEDIQFIYVDADKLPNSRSLVTLENIPTIVSFKGTENVGQDEGNKIDVVYSVLENLK
jgi:thiol-disulfide isomerase/thioredoxin